MTASAVFDVHEGVLRIDAPADPWLAPFRRALGAEGAAVEASCMPDALRIVLVEARSPAPPAGARLLETQTLGTGDLLRLHESGDAWWLEVPGACVLRFGRDGGRIEAACTAGLSAALLHEVAMLALEEALDRGGQSVVHAGTLGLPGQAGFVLLHAVSGIGKTTAALALAGAGFRLAGDDATVLSRRPGGPVAAWGLPRPVNLHRNTARMLPWVAPALGPDWDANGEQRIALSRLAGLVPVDRSRQEVVALVLLERGGSAAAGLAPMPKGDALAALIADNVRVSGAGLLGAQARRLDLLAQLVEQVPCYRLSVGASLSDLATLLSETCAAS